MRLDSLCLCLFILYSSLFLFFSLYIFNSLAPVAAGTGISALSLAPLFFTDVVRRVSVCVFQHALVAGAAFADGVACAEWAAAVLVAGA